MHASSEPTAWDRLLELPLHIQCDIVAMLPRENKHALRLTCQVARRVLDEAVVCLTLTRLAQCPEDAAIQAQLFSRFPNVRALHLDCEGMNTQGMQHFVKLNAVLMRRLNTLTTHRMAMLLPETWDTILQACDATRLQIWRPCLSNRRLPAFVHQILHLASQPSCALTALDLSFSPVSMPNLQQVIKGCPHLKDLNLDNVSKLTDDGLAMLASLTKLEKLSVDKCHLTFEGFSALSRLPSFTHLNLGAQQCETTEKGCRAVASLPALTQLHMIGFPSTFKDLGVLVHERHPCHASLRHIILERSHIPEAVEQDFKRLVEAHHQLKVEFRSCWDHVGRCVCSYDLSSHTAQTRMFEE